MNPPLRDDYAAVVQRLLDNRAEALSGQQYAEDDQPPPEVVYRYRVSTEENGGYLGHGAYGVVVKAYDQIEQRHVAVKYVTIIEDPRQARRLLREIQLMQHFCTKDHPGLVSLYDIACSHTEEGEAMVFIMECTQTSLDRLFRDSKLEFSVLQIRHLVAQLLYGLEFIHKSEVIHRDLKPANVLIQIGDRHEGGAIQYTAKICDMGLGRSVNSFMLSSYVMTMFWRAPEVLLGTKDYTHAVDLWSLGCILAQMFNRRARRDNGELAYEPLFANAVNCYKMVDLIMALVGEVSEETIQSLGNRFTQAHLRQYPREKPMKLKWILICPDRITELPPDAEDLIWKMLTVDPIERISAHLARTHPFVEPALELLDTQLLEGFCEDAEPFVDEFDEPLRTSVLQNNDVDNVMDHIADCIVGTKLSIPDPNQAD